MEYNEEDNTEVTEEIPENCERCGEETLSPLEECPSCGRFLCDRCIGLHSCDDADFPLEGDGEEDEF
jgi:hypothetical protein